MKKQILTTLLTLFLVLLPAGIADNPHIGYYPVRTGSPMVEVPMLQSRYFNPIGLSPIREGLPILVYGQLPELPGEEASSAPIHPESSLLVDEYGVLVNYQNEPVLAGTTGYSFAHGYDWTRIYPWNRVGNYFSSNLRGFKASLSRTYKLKDYGGRTWGVYMYGGYGPALQVIKQWYKPRTEKTGYSVPGVSNLITKDAAYVRPGIPSQPLPEETRRSKTIEIEEKPAPKATETEKAAEEKPSETINVDEIVIE